MLKVGITGGIGSGKTMVSRLFEMLSVPVYYADDAAKTIMNTSDSIRNAIIEHFGAATYSIGILNRQILSGIVFNNPQKLELLNSIVHPVVIGDAKSWMNQQQAPIVMKEAAIFFESGSYKEMDLMIGVYAPAPIRIARVMQRDKTTAAAVEERMSRQMNEDEKMKRCDFVITNDEQQLLIPQVISLFDQLNVMVAGKAV